MKCPSFSTISSRHFSISNGRPGDQELVDTAFRALHTIKGSGAMFGFEQVAGFTHEFETLVRPHPQG